MGPTPPPKLRGRGVARTTPYHLEKSDGPVIKACPPLLLAALAYGVHSLLNVLYRTRRINKVVVEAGGLHRSQNVPEGCQRGEEWPWRAMQKKLQKVQRDS